MKLTTSPRHWLDFVLWPILKLVWEPFSLKRSHFWHWRDYPLHYQLANTIKVDGDPLAESRKGLLSNLWQTNFGWRKVAVFRGPAGMDYHLGFESTENGKTVRKICSVVLRGKSAGLVGYEDVKFFMVSAKDKTSVCITILALTSKARKPFDALLV